MAKRKKNYLEDISTNIIDNSLSITTISKFNHYYVLALQTKIQAFDNSGIGHLFEHLIIDKANEILECKGINNQNTHIYGATYPNYVIFYIDSSTYEDFYSALNAFLYVYSNFIECRSMYEKIRIDLESTDANSIFYELKQREVERISVIWQFFYSKRFGDTDFRYNSGGHTSAIYGKTFEELNEIWGNVSQKKIDVVVSVPNNIDEVIDSVFSFHRRSIICDTNYSFDFNALPISNNRYKSNLPSSFSYGIGIVNKNNSGNNFYESLLYNCCLKHEKIRRGIDFLYDNATIYGMFYFGIHTIKKVDDITSEYLFDLFLQLVSELDENLIEKVFQELIERLQLIYTDDKSTCIEIIARIMQRFRRDQSLDETLFDINEKLEINGSILKDILVHMIMDFRNDRENSELLFCYQ